MEIFKKKKAGLTLNGYQDKAMTTCTPSSANFAYMMLNLVGEVGEFASKVAKGVRKDEINIVGNNFKHWVCGKEFCSKQDELLRKEAGDILWQLAGLCKVMGWKLEDVANENLAKLAARKANGTIVGEGDGVTKEERK